MWPSYNMALVSTDPTSLLELGGQDMLVILEVKNSPHAQWWQLIPGSIATLCLSSFKSTQSSHQGYVSLQGSGTVLQHRQVTLVR